MAIPVPINVKMLGKSMIDAARRAASTKWGDVRGIAEMQLRTLAHAAGEIDDLMRTGQINDARAAELFAMHRTAAQSVLHTHSDATSALTEILLRAAIGAIGGKLGGAIAGQFKSGKDL